MYFTLYFWGYPVKVLLLNDDLKKFDLYVTPWLGIGVIIAVLFPLSWLGFSVQSAANYFFAAVLAINVVLWLKYREPMMTGGKEAVLIALIGFTVASIYGSILYLKGFEYAAVTNVADFSSYLLDAKAALVSSANYINDRPLGIPHIVTSDQSLNFDFRGCLFVLSLFAALFGADLADIFYFISAFIMFLNVIIFRLFMDKTSNIVVPFLLLGMLAFNNFYQRLVFFSFTGQMFSIGIVLLAVYLAFYMFERGKFDPRTCVLTAFVLTVNGLNYIEALAYPIVPALVFVCVVNFNPKYDKKACWKNTGLVAGLFTVINIPVIINFMKLFFAFESVFTGWAMHIATFYDISGAYGAMTSPNGRFAMLLFANLLLFCVLIRQIKREGPMSFLSICCFSYLFLYIFFCFKYFKYGGASSYNAYKSAISLSFITVIMFIRFLKEKLDSFYKNFTDFLNDGAPERKSVLHLRPLGGKHSVAAVIFLIFFVLSIRATYVSTPPGVMTRDYSVLRYFSENSYYSGSAVILDCADIMAQWTAEYYAPFGRTYNSGFSRSLGRSMREFFEPGDIYVANPMMEDNLRTINSGKTIFANGVYKIYRVDEDSIILHDYSGVSFGLNYIDASPDVLMARAVTDNKIGLRFVAIKDKPANICITFFKNAVIPLGARAYVNGDFIVESIAVGQRLYLKLDGVSFSSGVNDLVIELDGDISDVYLARMDIGQ
jgi:hypothetical protein